MYSMYISKSTSNAYLPSLAALDVDLILVFAKLFCGAKFFGKKIRPQVGGVGSDALEAKALLHTRS